MDIAPLKLQIRRTKRDAARRHTTEINFDQLRGRAISELEKDAITSLSTEHLSGESYDDGVHKNKDKVSGEPYLNSSWSNMYDGMGGLDTPESDSSSYYVGSQEDILKELNEVPKNNHLNVSSRHQYQLSYELALDNMLTPFTSPAPIVSPLTTAALSKPKTHSYNPKHVIDEMVTTEQSYITDLSDIIDGYLAPFERRVAVLPLEQQDIDDLFGNILEIRDFHQNLLRLLFEGGHNPGKIAACFLQEAEGFKIYTQYCNNYPRSVHTFKIFCEDPDISPFLKSCQLRLHHMLPLDAFLLKPVQRVLKYSLLLYEMGKRTRRDSENHGVVQRALEKMTDVAQHINSMKRKYEMTVHIEEVQRLIRGEWTGLNLSKYGDIVLEENMRYAHYGGKNARFRTERYVFLFQKLCLITKREEDGYYYYKAHIEMADLQLTEKVDKLPRCFQLRQVSTGKYHTFMTANPRSKDTWVRNIKLLLVESIPHLPDKARQLIMQGFDITPDHSPKRERHVRHHSEEPQRFQIHTSSHQSGRSSLDSTNKSLTFGRFSTEIADRKSKQKMRSSTAPSSGPGSLKSLMASPLHNFHPMVEENEVSLHTDEELNHSTQTVGEKRDNGFLETSSSNQNGDLGRHPQAAVFVDTSTAHSDAAQKRSPKLRIPQLSHSSSSSPQIGMATISEHNSSPNLRRAEVLSKLDVSEQELDAYENAHKMKGIQDIHRSDDRLRSERVSLPNIENHSQLPDMANVIIPPPKLYLNTPPPSVEIEIESDTVQAATSEASLKFTDLEDQENLFDELMSSSSTLSEIFHREPDSDDENARTVFLEQSREDRLPPYMTHHDNEVEDDNVTPQASPCPSPNSSIRRWSISRNSNPRHIDEDMIPTPTASPFVRRPLSSSSSCTSSPSTDNASSIAIDPPTPFRHLSPEPYVNVVQTSASVMDTSKGKQPVFRRHSFSNDRKRNTVHHRQESRSMEASPQSTPKVKRSDRTANECLPCPVANEGDFNCTSLQAPHTLRDIPTINIESCSESDLTPIQNPDSVILPPPMEFMDQKNQLPHDNSHSNNSPSPPTKSPGVYTYEDDRNHNSHATSGLEKDQVTTITPYESNPNEMMSFTEVLATFDDFASTTGKTTKSAKSIVKLRSRSPEAKRRKEKKKKRSQTISMIDADTMNQVREELARRSDDKPSDSLRPPEQKSDSKVHNLAREYSRKIKDQRGGIFKRFSTVVEEPLPSKGTSEPEWLQQLKDQKKRSTEAKPISPSTAELELPERSPQSVPSEVAALTGSLKRTKSRVKDYPDYEDQRRKGGLRGWVRSLVDKISTSGYVKEK